VLEYYIVKNRVNVLSRRSQMKKYFREEPPGSMLLIRYGEH
jgi:hypothetical protein